MLVQVIKHTWTVNRAPALDLIGRQGEGWGGGSGGDSGVRGDKGGRERRERQNQRNSHDSPLHRSATAVRS